MDETLQKIEHFLQEHHVLNLATQGERLWCCSMFYAYKNRVFYVASEETTEHMQNVFMDNRIAGTVVLETELIGKIQGIQFYGVMEKSTEGCEKIYFERFPYARVMDPTIWSITLHEIKLTDNRFGFGKKLRWKREI